MKAKFIDGTLNKEEKDILTAIRESPEKLTEDDIIEGPRSKAAFAVKAEKNRKEMICQTYNIRKECGEVNGQIVEFLIKEKVPDPMTYKVFFETFPPINRRTLAIAESKLREEQAELERKERQRQFQEKNIGIEMGGNPIRILTQARQ